MTGSELLIDGFGRIKQIVHGVVEGLGPDELSFRIEGRANSIAWLVWHLTRIQDDHIAHAGGTEQVWTSGRWMDRFALPFDVRDTGFRHSPEEVAAVRVRSAELLTGYHDAAHEQTVRFLDRLGDRDYERIVDESFDPPVSLGVRLVSVISDDLQHAGQAGFVRGLLERASRQG